MITRSKRAKARPTRERAKQVSRLRWNPVGTYLITSVTE